MSGLFVVIEGLDGTGKSTLARGLAERLGGEARSTPGAAFRNLREPVLDALGPGPLERATFYAATVLKEGSQARSHAKQGGVTVIDRYWLSTLAYARARGATHLLAALEVLVPPPDITLFVTLDEHERQQRLFAREHCTAADRETLDPTFRQAVFRHSFEGVGEAFRPVRLDVTGLDPIACVEHARRTVYQQLERSVRIRVSGLR